MIIPDLLLTVAKRREWMGLGVAGMITTIVMKWIIPKNSRRKMYQ